MAHSEHTHSVAAACWMRARVPLCTNIIWLSFLGSGIQRETPSEDGRAVISLLLFMQSGKKTEDFLLRLCVTKVSRWGKSVWSRLKCRGFLHSFYCSFIDAQCRITAKKKKTLVCCNSMNSSPVFRRILCSPIIIVQNMLTFFHLYL